TFSLHSSRPYLHLHSFPTRRSSDLPVRSMCEAASRPRCFHNRECRGPQASRTPLPRNPPLQIARPLHRRSKGAPRVSNLRRKSRSEEHTSELQSLAYLVCRLLLEKK